MKSLKTDHSMKISPWKRLAALLACGAIFASGKVSAQNDGTQYSARPLPPLPTNIGDQQNADRPSVAPPKPTDSAMPLVGSQRTQRQSQTGAPVAARLKYPTLFVIESPPVPPTYHASARIVRPATVKPAATTEPAAREQSELISSPGFGVTVESQKNVELPPATNAEHVAELPKQFATQNGGTQREFLVSFQKRGDNGALDTALDSLVPGIDAAEITQNTPLNGISIDRDSFKAPESDDGAREGDDDIASENDGENGGEDDQLDTDDLELDAEDDNLQPQTRQFGAWPRKSMQEVSVDIRNPYGKVPADESGVLIASNQRFYRSSPETEKVFAWAAPKIRYQPLYFEDAQLERYGQTKGLIKQPFVSGFKFFRDAALLPLNASIDCPGSCDGPLGFCRPGSPCGDSRCGSCQR